MEIAHDAAKGEAGGSPEEHARSENGLRHGAPLIGERIGNHRLGGRSVGGLAYADQGTCDEQKHKRGGEAAGNGGEAPDSNAGRNDLRAAPAVGEEAAGNTSDGEDHEKPGLQGTELGVGKVHLLAEEREERDNDLAVGEVDKINQSKYSKKTNLVGR